MKAVKVVKDFFFGRRRRRGGRGGRGRGRADNSKFKSTKK